MAMTDMMQAMQDAADIEYGQFTATHVRNERRRIWNGKRYVWRNCDVYDVCKPAVVAPSKLPLVEQVTRVPGLPSRRGHAIDVILEYIDSNGPGTLTELHQALGMPCSTIKSAVEKDGSGVSRADDYRWHLTDIPYEPDFLPLWRIILSHLDEYGASTVREIADTLEVKRSSIGNALRSQLERFEKVAMTKDGRSTIWDIKHEAF